MLTITTQFAKTMPSTAAEYSDTPNASHTYTNEHRGVSYILVKLHARCCRILEKILINLRTNLVIALDGRTLYVAMTIS
jgi:hypothetical protein